MLDSYESKVYSGVTVDLGVSGLYHDPKYGKNWWTYYFNPICIGSERAEKVVLEPRSVGACAIRAFFTLPKKRCNYLIKKYIQIKPEIEILVNNFISKELNNQKYISIQYRGTDKFGSESSYISPEEACEKIAKIIKTRTLSDKLIFVATDTEKFANLMKEKFGKRVVSYTTTKSTDGTPVHLRTDISGYQKGLEALVDCLLLSQSTFLIRTASNLSTTALLFNPKLESICLNKSRHYIDR